MKNYEAILDALKAGETLISVKLLKVKLEDGELRQTDKPKNFIPAPNFENPNVWQIYKEPKWFENIPNGGVLCWVKNRIDRDYNANPQTIRSFIGGQYIGWEVWKFAVPLTKQEIQVFMDNAPETK